MPPDMQFFDTATLDKLIGWIGKLRRVRVLVVTDGNVSFGSEHDPRNDRDTYFGMGHLMSVLESFADVTKAHRQTDPLTAPGVQPNFKFTPDVLDRHDQVWLIGHDSAPMLKPDELEALARFMNGGGGVFATGDHGALGAALASEVPRVRSMRHWASPPPPIGADRVDTTVPDAQGQYVFENQSDDLPQELQLRWYTWRDERLTRQIYPHPLMCGTSGPIDRFPDHMHEGEVVVPTQLDERMTIRNYSFDEYPADAAGVRRAPEIVAWGQTRGPATPEVMHDAHVGADDPATPRWTGTVGAYDGKAVGVGRVVVDSTWHHFFDINLVGDHAATRPVVTDPRKTLWAQGFTASPAGRQVLSQIDQYFRNIVHWLSPSVGGFVALAAELAVNRHVIELMGGEGVPAIHLGGHAAELARRVYPPCLLLSFNRHVIDEWVEIRDLPFGPWDWPYPGPDEAGRRLPVSPEELLAASLGAAILAVHELGPKALMGRQGPRRLLDAAVRGMRELLERRLGTLREQTRTLERALAADTARQAPVSGVPPTQEQVRGRSRVTARRT